MCIIHYAYRNLFDQTKFSIVSVKATCLASVAYNEFLTHLATYTYTQCFNNTRYMILEHKSN